MLVAHPLAPPGGSELLERCITALTECENDCTACADACLAEEGVAELRRCISLGLVCSDICAATRRTLVRRTHADAEVELVALRACAEACRSCADECDRHRAHHDHCRLCAESCRRCLDACEAAIAMVGGEPAA